VNEVIRDSGAGDIANVQVYDSPEDDEWHQPEWVPVSELSPLTAEKAKERAANA
jgi:hypothetical protein